MKVGSAAQICFVLLLLNLDRTICRTDIVPGHEVTLAVPAEYGEGFIGRAFLIETEHLPPPNFRAALTVEATQGNFSCSLQVFLGEVKVWSSGHFSRFFTAEKCVLELTDDGDLRLKGPTGHVGWRTGTAGQGVEVHRTIKRCRFVIKPLLNLNLNMTVFFSIDAETENFKEWELGIGGCIGRR